VDIPQADLLIVRFDVKDARYMAILKLNYKDFFTHNITAKENQIIKCNTALPFDNGRILEACLIPFDPMTLKILERPFLVDGEPVNYFSELFLECDTSLSKKETAQLITEVTEEFVEEYLNNDVSTLALVKTAMIEKAEEAEETDYGAFAMESVADKAFADADEVKGRYIETLREAGIKADLPLDAKFTRQQFGTQKIKADNGVEIKFPAELAADSGVMEITSHTDGTVSVLFKRLKPVEKK